MTHIAPAGTPVGPLTLAAGLIQGLGSSRAADALSRALAEHSGHTHCRLFSTGRAAMVVALQALRDVKNDPARTEVIVAGYTCYSVAASVLRAGLKPRLCDVDPRTLTLQLDSLRNCDFSKVLAIVSANLYGLPNALTQIEGFARAHGIAMLDDAAQALGARYAGRPVGGFGDIGLYSFDKGKNITSMEGGALVMSEPSLVAALEKRYAALPRTSVGKAVVTVAKLAAYAMLLQPRMYSLVRKLPFLGLGKTIYEEDYPLHRYHPLLAGFALRLFRDLPRLSAARARNADALRAELERSAIFDTIELLPQAHPSYTRLPVMMRDPRARDEVIRRLETAGIGATISYPKALDGVQELQDRLITDPLPGARWVSDHIVTLPVHPYCGSGYEKRISKTLETVPSALHEQPRSVAR